MIQPPPPLVSILIPTIKSREKFLKQVLKYVSRQDWPYIEVIVIGDVVLESSPIPIQIISTGPQTTIGAKLNMGARKATGSILVRFDDDDWFSPKRVSCQVGTILTGGYDIVILGIIMILETNPLRYWKCDHPYGGAGDLAVTKKWWWSHPFSESPYGEDGEYISRIQTEKGKWIRLFKPGISMYVRHGKNKTTFSSFSKISKVLVPKPEWVPEEDHNFYVNLGE